MIAFVVCQVTDVYSLGYFCLDKEPLVVYALYLLSKNCSVSFCLRNCNMDNIPIVGPKFISWFCLLYSATLSMFR